MGRYRGRSRGRGFSRGNKSERGLGSGSAIEQGREDLGVSWSRGRSPARFNFRGRGRGNGRGFPPSFSNNNDSDRSFSFNSRRSRKNRNRNKNKRGRLLATVEREMLAEARRCCECKKDDAVYRCPTCLKKYCSLLCFKSHKAGSSCIPIKLDPPESTMDTIIAGGSRRKSTAPKQYFYPTTDTIRPEGLEKLNQPPLRETMLLMFKSRNLREKIVAIDSSTQSAKLFDHYMKDEEFAKFSSFVVDALSDEFMDTLSKDFLNLQVQKKL